MRRDDVAQALDALAAEVPAPTADAGSLIARGRRRIVRQRILIIAIAAAVIATAAGVGAAANRDNTPRIVAPVPTTPTTSPSPPPEPTATTPTPNEVGNAVPAPLAFASATEGWICDDPFEYTTDAFETVGEHVNIPTAAYPAEGQERLCAAAPGGNAWLVRAGAPGHPEIVRIRSGGTDVQVFPFPPTPAIESISFVDADNGWALAGWDGQHDLYRTHDGGSTWSLILPDAPILGSLAFATPDRGWAAGAAGCAARHDDRRRTHVAGSRRALTRPAPRLAAQYPGRPGARRLDCGVRRADDRKLPHAVLRCEHRRRTQLEPERRSAGAPEGVGRGTSTRPMPTTGRSDGRTISTSPTTPARHGPRTPLPASTRSPTSRSSTRTSRSSAGSETS